MFVKRCCNVLVLVLVVLLMLVVLVVVLVVLAAPLALIPSSMLSPTVTLVAIGESTIA